MAKAPVNRNPAKIRFGANVSRPNGASVSAEAADDDQLLHAAMYGNRATRRLAARNLKKRVRG